MDVHLLVYDLSRGLARQMSMPLLGIQLDAIYHTSVELQGREFVYDGGIVAIQPGSSHLGQPMERLHLGRTSLPMDIVEEYLDSIRPIFTLEAYDLLWHNCNNFTDSFSNFLLGKGIPSHISQMSQTVLDSPMGGLVLFQLAQGTNAGRRNGSILGLEQSAQAPAALETTRVKNVTGYAEFSSLLAEAKRSCAVVFFTSARCPPCKTLYPLYNQLAEEIADKVTFIKVDIAHSQNSAIASQFSIQATPTFVTLVKGEEENRWSGTDPDTLRGNVHSLAPMSRPIHPHEKLHLPSFSNANAKPVLFGKMPPLPKLMAKLGNELVSKPQIQQLKHLIETRAKDGPQNTVVPNLGHMAGFVQESVSMLPPEVLFIIADLFRCALIDPRVSGYFAEEMEHKTLLGFLNCVSQQSDCPYPLRLVTIQMACNFFSTPLFPHEIFRNARLRTPITQLISSSFLDDSHNSVRVAASSLLFNIALAARESAANSPQPGLPEEDQVELAASVVEAIAQEEESAESLQGMLSALGHLVYCTNLDGELADLLRALDAEGTIEAKKKSFPNEKLVIEVGSELLGKGLGRK